MRVVVQRQFSTHLMRWCRVALFVAAAGLLGDCAFVLASTWIDRQAIRLFAQPIRSLSLRWVNWWDEWKFPASRYPWPSPREPTLRRFAARRDIFLEHRCQGTPAT